MSPPKRASRNVVDLRPKPMTESPRSVPVRSSEPTPPPASGRRAKKRVPLKDRRRRMRMVLASVCVVLCGAAAYGVHYVSYLPQYNVSAVRVSGARTLAPEAIQSYVETQLHAAPGGFISPTNVITFDAARIQNGIIHFFPRIRSVSIERDTPFSTSMNVNVTERDGFAQWCADDATCYLMDDTGYIFDGVSASTTETMPYVFHNGIDASSTPIGKTYADGHFPNMAALLKAFARENIAPTGATVDNDRDFSVSLQNGYFVRVSYGADADALVRNLQLVLGSDALASTTSALDYIDLRFGDRVYYKFKGQESAIPAGSATSSASVAHTSSATSSPMHGATSTARQ